LKCREADQQTSQCAGSQSRDWKVPTWTFSGCKTGLFAYISIGILVLHTKAYICAT
jgi:hypothetical protein